ncbi:geranylgeranylglycerol-phosphate geranylgeranyltransferase [Infirmifilum lucidum]|uniref:Geranylgeranylglycerol-phosphate geranylgeranyltransferase n=1 Tax=Infirmifilum lucidum TaxID=2776706 RepID=A0A7L9FG45_9CREN|nr:geranylgeranylglycerol-phosphate geranylgeranyltransferase [Infirmifilum lucidum]QOJ78770.1 geranylgeranylglycerol-phosphate geranylgeranyltransferase [Infirmifilum lucidum]
MTVQDWLRLARVGNCLVIALGVLTGYVAGGGSVSDPPWLLVASAPLIAAGGNALNDVMDVEADKINKPWRPVARGYIRREDALAFSAATVLGGTALGFAHSLPAGILAALASLLLVLYDVSLKATGVSGNITIALLSSLNIVYGGLAAPKPLWSLLPALFAFLLVLGREFMKGLEDISGDLRAGYRTLASTRGPRAAFTASALTLLSVVALSPLPLLYGYGALYLLLAVLGVDAPVALTLLYARRDPVSRAWRSTRLLKLPILMGLLAFSLGRCA